MRHPAWGLVALALLVACGSPDGDDSAVTRLQERRAQLAEQFTDCARDSATPNPALVSRARCLTVTVPENPDQPAGRTIELKVMVIPAIKPVPAPDPFVILVGGPGEAATESGLNIVPLFSGIRRDRDIVLIDQRGTGELSPFDCNAGVDELEDPASLETMLARQRERLSRCLEELDVRAEYYTTDIAVGDLEAVRDYLGYSRLNLWGGSYGTRVALAYLRAYPEATRTVVLDGAAPPSIFPITGDPGAALERVLAACEASSACDAEFPDLRGKLEMLLTRLETPERVELRDPRSAEPEPAVEIGAGDVRNALFLSLYSRELTRLIPLMIERMYRGEYQALAALSEAVQANMSEGMFYSVVCSEDMSRLSPQELAAMADSDSLLTSEMRITPLVEACNLWPTRELDPDYFEPVVSDKPVLILSGRRDPVTPPRWGEQVAATLTRSEHLVVAGAGHITSPYGCLGSLIADFVAAGNLEELDTGCVDRIRPRPFFLTAGGSATADD